MTVRMQKRAVGGCSKHEAQRQRTYLTYLTDCGYSIDRHLCCLF